VTEADIMEYDLDSNPVRDPGRRQYSERYIHGEIYKLRPDVLAVVHAHTPSVVPFTVSSVPLRAIAHSGGFLAEGLPLFEIRDVGGMTDMLVSDAKLGHALAAKLESEAIALGGTITYLDPEEGRKIEARRDYIRPWELWKRQAMGK
jgi:ribulose-5-phosphate 4-epimerase/fuculose-1-phosphate aldolase